MARLPRYVIPDSRNTLSSVKINESDPLIRDSDSSTARRADVQSTLAVPRFRGGKRLPPQLQRMDAEDFVAVVFPDQLACVENIQGEREVPDHPLVNQTIHDCLHEAMDIDGLEKLLAGIERGDIKIVARDLLEPSPFAQEILSARPYAFLDDAPLEERRTRAVQIRRFLDPQQAADLGRLDQAAIERVREEAWPSVTNSDELHDALMMLGYMTPDELSVIVNGGTWLAQLTEQQRATTVACAMRTEMPAVNAYLVRTAHATVATTDLEQRHRIEGRCAMVVVLVAGVERTEVEFVIYQVTQASSKLLGRTCR